MAAAVASRKLLCEIHEQFLVCKICLEDYHRPKTLPCLHTFCQQCLIRHQDAEVERSYRRRFLLQSRSHVTCPICRQRTELPPGGIPRLPDNFLVQSLEDMVERIGGVAVGRHSASKVIPLCDLCRTISHRTPAVGLYAQQHQQQLQLGQQQQQLEQQRQQQPDEQQGAPSVDNNPHDASPKIIAVSKCLDCSKMFCRTCTDLHRRTKVTADHGLFDIEVEEKDVLCKVHTTELVRFYCEPCSTCICVLCTFQDHAGHEVSTFAEGVERHGHVMTSLVDQCRTRCDSLRQRLTLIGQCEERIEKTQGQIHNTATEGIATIRRQEQKVLGELYTAFCDSRSKEFLEKKRVWQDTVQTLETTCDLTEIITRDKSVELLLLKNDIIKKMTSLLDEVRATTPPDSISRPCEFVPGSLIFGYLDFTPASEQVYHDRSHHSESHAHHLDNSLSTGSGTDNTMHYSVRNGDDNVFKTGADDAISDSTANHVAFLTMNDQQSRGEGEESISELTPPGGEAEAPGCRRPKRRRLTRESQGILSQSNDALDKQNHINEPDFNVGYDSITQVGPKQMMTNQGTMTVTCNFPEMSLPTTCRGMQTKRVRSRTRETTTNSSVHVENKQTMTSLTSINDLNNYFRTSATWDQTTEKVLSGANKITNTDKSEIEPGMSHTVNKEMTSHCEFFDNGTQMFTSNTKLEVNKIGKDVPDNTLLGHDCPTSSAESSENVLNECLKPSTISVSLEITTRPTSLWNVDRSENCKLIASMQPNYSGTAFEQNNNQQTQQHFAFELALLNRGEKENEQIVAAEQRRPHQPHTQSIKILIANNSMVVNDIETFFELPHDRSLSDASVIDHVIDHVQTIMNSKEMELWEKFDSFTIIDDTDASGMVLSCICSDPVTGSALIEVPEMVAKTIVSKFDMVRGSANDVSKLKFCHPTYLSACSVTVDKISDGPMLSGKTFVSKEANAAVKEVMLVSSDCHNSSTDTELCTRTLLDKNLKASLPDTDSVDSISLSINNICDDKIHLSEDGCNNRKTIRMACHQQHPDIIHHDQQLRLYRLQSKNTSGSTSQDQLQDRFVDGESKKHLSTLNHFEQCHVDVLKRHDTVSHGPSTSLVQEQIMKINLTATGLFKGLGILSREMLQQMLSDDQLVGLMLCAGPECAKRQPAVMSKVSSFMETFDCSSLQVQKEMSGSVAMLSGDGHPATSQGISDHSADDIVMSEAGETRQITVSCPDEMACDRLHGKGRSQSADQLVQMRPAVYIRNRELFLPDSTNISSPRKNDRNQKRKRFRWHHYFMIDSQQGKMVKEWYMTAYGQISTSGANIKSHLGEQLKVELDDTMPLVTSAFQPADSVSLVRQRRLNQCLEQKDELVKPVQLLEFRSEDGCVGPILLSEEACGENWISVQDDNIPGGKTKKRTVIDKETNTPLVTLMHRNTATDNQTTSTKETSTSIMDVAATYRHLIHGELSTPRVTISRGTCTSMVSSSHCPMVFQPYTPNSGVDRASSPLDISPHLVEDRASSPLYMGPHLVEDRASSPLHIGLHLVRDRAPVGLPPVENRMSSLIGLHTSPHPLEERASYPINTSSPVDMASTQLQYSQNFGVDRASSPLHICSHLAVDRASSPLHCSLYNGVDRASSPVRVLYIDKAVSANKGEILAPIDVYHSPGKLQSKAQRTVISETPRLDSINEGSDESPSSSGPEDEPGLKTGAVLSCIDSSFSVKKGDRAASKDSVFAEGIQESELVVRAIRLADGKWPQRDWGMQHGIKSDVVEVHSKQEAFWQRSGRGPQSTNARERPPMETRTSRPALDSCSQFMTSACEHNGTSSIIWKVEMGTNTSSVEYHDKCVGTDIVTSIDGKMAECINKLKNVRVRLECPTQISTVVRAVQTTMTPGQATTVTAAETTGTVLQTTTGTSTQTICSVTPGQTVWTSRSTIAVTSSMQTQDEKLAARKAQEQHANEKLQEDNDRNSIFLLTSEHLKLRKSAARQATKITNFTYPHAMHSRNMTESRDFSACTFHTAINSSVGSNSFSSPTRLLTSKQKHLTSLNSPNLREESHRRAVTSPALSNQKGVTPLARKQRLEINQLLRSISLPETETSPSPLPLTAVLLHTATSGHLPPLPSAIHSAIHTLRVPFSSSAPSPRTSLTIHSPSPSTASKILSIATTFASDTSTSTSSTTTSLFTTSTSLSSTLSTLFCPATCLGVTSLCPAHTSLPAEPNNALTRPRPPKILPVMTSTPLRNVVGPVCPVVVDARSSSSPRTPRAASKLRLADAKHSNKYFS